MIYVQLILQAKEVPLSTRTCRGGYPFESAQSSSAPLVSHNLSKQLNPKSLGNVRYGSYSFGMAKRKTKSISKLEHTIHILLSLGTSGAWLLVYVTRVVLNRKRNRLTDSNSLAFDSNTLNSNYSKYERRKFPSLAEAEEDEWNELIDDYSFQIVGESHYRENLLSIIEKHNAHKSGELYLEAILVKEPNNKFDDSAVAVFIDGLKVGHVSKEYSFEVTEFLNEISVNGIKLQAVIGWNNSSPNPPIGVRLDFNF